MWGRMTPSRRESECSKIDFNLLFDVLKKLWPHPHSSSRASHFSILFSLHTWLQSASKTHHMGFIDKFNLFWDCPSLFNRQGIHPKRQGSHTLSANLQHMVQTVQCD